MSKKVLVATEKPFSPAAVERLVEVFKAANYEVQLLESYTDKADLLSAVVDADALKLAFQTPTECSDFNHRRVLSSH